MLRAPLRLASLFLFLTTILPPAPAATATPRETWYGVYLGGKRAGYLMSVEQRTRWRGQKADLSTSRMRMDLRVLGAANTSEMESQEWATPEGAPLEAVSVERTGGRATKVRAVFTARSVTYDADLAGERRHGTLRLKAGERFWAEDPFKSKQRRRPSAETRIRYKTFNTTTLTLDDADVTIGRRTPAAKREIVDVGGLGVAAYRVAIKVGGAPATIWLDARDDVLRFDLGPARFIRQPKGVAAAPLSDAVEVTDVAAYRPQGKPLTDPRTLREGTYRIENLSAPLETTNDDVQRATLERGADGSYVARITVTTGPASDAPPTAIAAIDRAAHAARLGPSLYVPSDTAPMKALAGRILGGETDAARAAGLLSDWVYKTMTYDAGQGIGVQRHASEILRSRRGVCQDYATLLVTLARAAGIPAKHCSGLAYLEGRFFLHAWAEVWVGKWVALEPTWGAPFADATHIKLAEGEPTTDRKGMSRLDPLRITVLETAASPAIIPSNHVQ